MCTRVTLSNKGPYHVDAVWSGALAQSVLAEHAELDSC